MELVSRRHSNLRGRRTRPLVGRSQVDQLHRAGLEPIDRARSKDSDVSNHAPWQGVGLCFRGGDTVGPSINLGRWSLVSMR